MRWLGLLTLAVLTLARLERPMHTEEVRVSFETVLQRTLKHEGGWYDGTKPHDPNPTMKGVTQKTYDAWRDRRGLEHRTVRQIETVELVAIYRTYWNAVKGDTLPPHTAAMVFDHAVNAGPHRAIQALQRAIHVTPDGVIGPRTMEAVRRQEDAVLAQLVAGERLRHYCDLARSPKHRPSLLSWVKRVVDEGEQSAAECLDKRFGVA